MRRFLKLLVYGGSFDPPHLGHIQLLKAGIKYAKPDKVIILPAYRSPLKHISLTGYGFRSAMIKIALKKSLPKKMFSKITVSRYESRRKTKTYTYQTLRMLKKLYHKAELSLLMGEDCAKDLPKWKNPDYIASACRILVGRRKSSGRLPSTAKKLGIRYLPGQFPDISSSAIRMEMYPLGVVPKSVPAPVRRFIELKTLYALNAHKWLKRNLSKKRYIHSQNTAELAQHLALLNRYDADSAAWAALLHDAGKFLQGRELAGYAKANRLAVPAFRAISKNAPGLLHPYVSSHLAERKFGIENRTILNAIKNHTLGARNMTLLDKILYVADTAARDRKHPSAKRVRELAKKDINAALMESVKAKLAYAINSKKWINPAGIRIWNHMLAQAPRGQ